VFINVGREPSVDEEALIEAALKDNSGGLKGAGLDVFATEPPLPLDSELRKLDNVLVSPHNVYQQEILQDEADFFVDENLPRFLRDEELLNPVDKGAGY
jgi:phosphoglycerate dehydrogenase-like enzyme